MDIKSKALLAYAIIFLVGGASGFFLNEAIRPQPPRNGSERTEQWNRFQPRDGQRGERMRQKMGNYLAGELDLEEDQREPFFDTLDEHLSKLHSGIRDYRSEEIVMIRELYAQFIDDVEEILTASQLEELNRIAHPDSVQQRRMQRRRHGEEQ